MKVILAHNFYQHPGGEDRVYSQERQLLESHGNTVITYQRSNSETVGISALQTLGLPRKMFWASDAYQHMRQLLRQEKPQIVHVHNTFFQISPAIFSACQKPGVPVVQTLHNFRLMCPAATYFREGKICEKCRESGLLQGIRHGCYRESRGATTAVALMLAMHRRARTWIDKVTFTSPSPNFPGANSPRADCLPIRSWSSRTLLLPIRKKKRCRRRRGVCRPILAGKGCSHFASSLAKLGVAIPLKILGDGPLAGQLRQMA